MVFSNASSKLSGLSVYLTGEGSYRVKLEARGHCLVNKAALARLIEPCVCVCVCDEGRSNFVVPDNENVTDGV